MVKLLKKKKKNSYILHEPGDALVFSFPCSLLRSSKQKVNPIYKQWLSFLHFDNAPNTTIVRHVPSFLAYCLSQYHS